MRRFLKELFSAPFQLVLVISFSLVAATTIAVGTWVISRTIRDYLAEAMTERVDRDMRLAEGLYAAKLREVAGIADRLALDPQVRAGLSNAQDAAALDARIGNELTAPLSGGNHFAAILDDAGLVRAARLLPTEGGVSRPAGSGDWSTLPVVQRALATGQASAATEVIPPEVMASTGLAAQACIDILDTPKASTVLCDPSEGQAGLALVGVTPVIGGDGGVLGATIAFHMVNNDFTLVDQIQEAAGVDTATIFHGDLRVSTNVLTPEGKRAIGTRISEEVGQIVLGQARPFTGPAFVVNENYITRYDPVLDHLGRVVGSLYVGVRQSAFNKLVNTFYERIVLVGLATILATFLLAIPVSRRITHPLKELRDLAGANRRVAAGDMSVRVPVRAGGDVGQLAGSFNTMLDELQATHDQLVHSEKLASLGQLAAGVAHELNNPLATVLLYSDILQRECPPDDPRRADLEMIVGETKRCKGIVASLLDFARQNQVEARPTELNALIRNVVEVQQKREFYAGIIVVTDLDPNLPKIEADHAQLQEVFVNLMSNGVDAMPAGGTLTLRTRSGPSGMVTVEVADSGEGIAPEHLGKLFTPFFSTKPVGKGTGLGLAIVYGIIKMHRGQINVRSQVGQGTTFIIQLPVTLPSGQPFGAAGMPPTNPGAEKLIGSIGN
jgi:two-component system NtrC family sensor kinase